MKARRKVVADRVRFRIRSLDGGQQFGGRSDRGSGLGILIGTDKLDF